MSPHDSRGYICSGGSAARSFRQGGRILIGLQDIICVLCHTLFFVIRCELIYWSAKVYFVRFFFLLLPGLPHHRAKHVQRPISLSRSDIKMLRKSAKESNFTEKVRKQSLFIVIMYSFPVSDRANPSSHNSQITRALELNVQMRSMMAESSC